MFPKKKELVSNDKDCSTVMNLRCFRKTLFFVNNETFQYVYEMEIIFRQYISHFQSYKIDKAEKTRHVILQDSEVDIFGGETNSDEDFILSESEVESEEDGLDYDDDYECSPKKVLRRK
ncbi:PREDICTED: uncharacterized protein LOC108749765 [Trachymyrmex septentrionalis]|uniref:uncharacterized protein LOC108749765 n=1 Tax=Trachymyrmex septentrionalis TaxID=34720 RepID=UPI00084F5BA6|nr:PREDICTED: uncharacterized protein LOC108749765 [Trachymyrmex septentrionalis]